MNRRGFMGLLGSVSMLPVLTRAANAFGAQVVHQPFVVTPGGAPFSVGDLIRCEKGCDYAEIDGVSQWGWPELKTVSGNKNPVGRTYPIKCVCGAAAIREASE